MYKGYLIDLDGTAYRGCEVINETLQFVKKLHEKQMETEHDHIDKCGCGRAAK